MLLRDKSREMGRLEDNVLSGNDAPVQYFQLSCDVVFYFINRRNDGLVLITECGCKTGNLRYIDVVNVITYKTE